MAGATHLKFRGPSRPSDSVLKLAAPLSVWNKALAQAKRSPMVRFKAGAVIWNPSTELVESQGTSNPDIAYARSYASVHAEQHALARARHLDLEGCWCIIYTINCRGGAAYTSRPCHSCAKMLYNKGIEQVLYAERATDGYWTVLTETPSEMLRRSPHTQRSDYARKMRIPSPSV